MGRVRWSTDSVNTKWTAKRQTDREAPNGERQCQTDSEAPHLKNEPAIMPLSREAAYSLMTEYTQSESLRTHMLGVEAALRGYARLFDEPEEDWAVVALLHDFD